MIRVGIFAFFDNDGIVDEYVSKLLSSMQKVLTKLYVVVNGKITEDSRKLLEEYASDILFRENYGYDAGAYKNIILDYFSEDEWKTYDEAVLFNNTFYGPFFCMRGIFDSFNSKENVDFWGLSKWAGGKSALLDEYLPEHIQAYFIVIKRNILQSDSWLDFWMKMDYPNDYIDAIRDFEVELTAYFSGKGYRYKTWLEENGGAALLEPGKVVYNVYPYQMICEYQFPVLKYKAVNFYNFSQMTKIAAFIEKHYGYDFSIVLKHLERIQKYKSMSPFKAAELEKFYLKHDKVYVFGHGKYGREMKAYFDCHKWKLEGVIVSDNQGDKGLLSLNDVELNANDGIVIALGEKNLEEVKVDLKRKFEEEQLLFPVYTWQ